MGTSAHKGNKILVLGRDGVINRYREDHVKDPAEFDILPGVAEQLARLNRAGWQVVVATNQAGIGRGLIDMSSLNAIHAKMHSQLLKAGARISAVFFCPHVAEDQCDCRKPQAGMLHEIAQRFGAHPENMHVASDMVRDLHAAVQAGSPPHLLRTGRASALPDAELTELLEQWPQLTVHADLAALSGHLLLTHP